MGGCLLAGRIAGRHISGDILSYPAACWGTGACNLFFCGTLCVAESEPIAIALLLPLLDIYTAISQAGHGL